MKFDDYEKTYVSTYTEFAELVRSLLEDAIAKTEGIPRLQSTQARGKDVTSLKRKLGERGLLASERIESEIKDLAGVRLIFYTNTDIDRFLSSGLIPDTFDVDWKETRIHHPTDDNDQRRYQAIHYTVSLSGKHTALSEYKKFKGSPTTMTLEVCTRRFAALLKLLCKLQETSKQSLSNPRSAISLGKHLKTLRW